MSDDKPGTEESYSNATHAKSLVVSEIRTGAADFLIAAGWSNSRLGASLLRLVSEWDGAEKPRPVRDGDINRMAVLIAEKAGRAKPEHQDHRAAKQQAAEWLLHEQKILMGKLKTLPEVREQLRLRSEKTGHPVETYMAALLWWMDSMCHACHGRRWEVIPGTPTLSDRACPVCKGSGERPKPNGLETMAVVDYLNQCIYAARDSMRKKLRRFPHHAESAVAQK